MTVYSVTRLIGCDIEHVYFLMHNDVLDSTDDYHISANSVYEYLKEENLI